MQGTGNGKEEKEMSLFPVIERAADLPPYNRLMSYTNEKLTLKVDIYSGA